MIHEDTPTGSAHTESPTAGTPSGEQQLSLFDADDFLVPKEAEAMRPALLDDELDDQLDELVRRYGPDELRRALTRPRKRERQMQTLRSAS